MDDDSVTQRLRELAEQHRAGAISDARYAAEKRALLGDPMRGDQARETLMLPAVQPLAGDRQAGPDSQRSLILLVAGVGLVLFLLALVVWGAPWSG